ncbi:MAG: aminopeptidase [Christensenellales bacterium]
MNQKNIEKLAKILVDYSIRLKKGEKVLIEGSPLCLDLILEIIKQVYSKGGYPFVNYSDSLLTKQILMGTNEEHIKLMTKYMAPKMSDMDAYIGISATNNIYELNDVPIKNKNLYSKFYSKPVHSDIRVPKTKWVILKYPTSGFAQTANMSFEQYCDFYFNVCTLDYSKMNKAMDNLKNLMEKTNIVKIVGPDTDLTFSIKGIPAIKCAGEMNIPDGEVYTAPVKNSVNGYIHYNTSTIYNGIKFENIKLYFENGKIVKCEGNNQAELESIFNIDEGARYVGEFSFGLNPYILHPTTDILFDEKITGSIHFTPGASYDDAYNGNKSAVHWDLVLIQRKDYGGGKIYFDNKLIRKDGLFVAKELECLNPENLKNKN